MVTALAISLLLTGDVLANGVKLPDQWPPRTEENYAPMPLPYLENIPDVLCIDLGRQLFVDEFLIEQTDLDRVAHQPVKVDFNPILKAETDAEMGTYGNPGATAKDGGLWWDPEANVFKMWYEAGWLQHMAYAESKDGIHWTRPDLGIVPGTNIIAEDIISDSSTAWLDLFTTNRDERYKMFLRSPNSIPGSDERFTTGWCMVSADGIHWDKRVPTGPCGDRSTVFYNPFLGKWIYSIRNTGNVAKAKYGRCRYYLENEDFLAGAAWTKDDLHFWVGADSLDVPDPAIGDKPQLYNLSAVAYESIMLALPQIHLGPSNKQCRKTGVPKITELKVAYSRDGYHWDRRDRETFIRAERQKGFWDRGYVQSVGGICNIVGDELWFHYIGFSGKNDSLSDVYEFNGMHYGGATGMAVLRRDGFVSMEASGRSGQLTTRKLRFSGKNLFVNADCSKGSLRVEVLDEDGSPVKGYTAADCVAVSTDGTIVRVRWKNHASLRKFSGRPVRLRFVLDNGALYSFWVSPQKSGASHGYTAACGPGLKGGIDNEGLKAYNMARKYQINKR